MEVLQIEKSKKETGRFNQWCKFLNLRYRGHTNINGQRVFHFWDPLTTSRIDVPSDDPLDICLHVAHHRNQKLKTACDWMRQLDCEKSA